MIKPEGIFFSEHHFDPACSPAPNWPETWELFGTGVTPMLRQVSLH